VSRQTLKTAMDKADQAAMEALTPKSPGRKGKSKEKAQAAAMKQEKEKLQKDLDRWKQKYEIAMTFLDIHKKLLNGEALCQDPEEPKSPGGKKDAQTPQESEKREGSWSGEDWDRSGQEW